MGGTSSFRPTGPNQKEDIRVYTAKGEGMISLDSENVSFDLGDKFTTMLSYVTKIERGGNLPLGKIAVYIEAYDLSGYAHNFEVAMNETSYYLLKKKLGKI